MKKYYCHESSIIDNNVVIGDDTKIWHFSHMSSGVKIGKNCSLGQNVFVGNNVTIGNNVKVQNNVSVYEGVTLEDDVFCGPSCVFTNVKQPRSEFPVHKKYDKTLIKKGATIGANVTIVCGVTVGKYAFIGAGSVVTKDVPDFALIYGNPAKVQGKVDNKGKKII